MAKYQLISHRVHKLQYNKPKCWLIWNMYLSCKHWYPTRCVCSPCTSYFQISLLAEPECEYSHNLSRPHGRAAGGVSFSPGPPGLGSSSSRFQWGLQLQLQSTDLDPNFPKRYSDDLVPCWKEPVLNFKTEIRAKLPQSLGMFWSSGFGSSPSLIWTT